MKTQKIKMLFFSFVLFLVFTISHAVRNAKEEQTCQKLLTSQEYSPLIPTLKRNLNIDEDGEFSCELVLQDETLPPQIRVTIHEGLSWLAIRHVQMGLQRHRTVVRHLRILAEILPKHHGFSFRAGFWGLDSNVFEPEKAVNNLYNALYGPASNDKTITDDLRYDTRREYTRALAYLGRLEEAKIELIQALKLKPLDLGAAFFLRDLIRLIEIENHGTCTGSGLDSEIQSLLSTSDFIYKKIQQSKNEFQMNNYSGFCLPDTNLGSYSNEQEAKGGVLTSLLSTFSSLTSSSSSSSSPSSPFSSPPSSSSHWKPTRFQGRLPSTQEFESFVGRREPFVISLGDQLESLLQWQTQKWIQRNNNNNNNIVEDGDVYLTSKAGEELVQVEMRPRKFRFSDYLQKNSTTTTTAEEGGEESIHSSSSAHSCTEVLGLGIDVYRQVMTLKKFLSSDSHRGVRKPVPPPSYFESLISHSSLTTTTTAAAAAISSPPTPPTQFEPVYQFDTPLSYLNIQPSGLGKGIYRSPLHKLQDDIPPPPFLQQSKHWADMKDVSMWMSNALYGESFSRLHMDATDNLYVVVEGSKQFHIFSPDLSFHMQTVSPTYALIPNGLSFHFNPEKTFENHPTTLPSSLSPLNGDVIFNATSYYDTSNFHFSAAFRPDEAQTLGQEAVNKRVVLELKRGDMLFLPTGWFHQVASSPGHSLAINYWWKPPGWADTLRLEKVASQALYTALLKSFEEKSNSNQGVGNIQDEL